MPSALPTGCTGKSPTSLLRCVVQPLFKQSARTQRASRGEVNPDLPHWENIPEFSKKRENTLVGIETVAVWLVSGILRKHQEALQSRAGVCGLSNCSRGVSPPHQQLGGEANRGWVSALRATDSTLQIYSMALERRSIHVVL